MKRIIIRSDFKVHTPNFNTHITQDQRVYYEIPQWRHPEFCFRGAKDTFPNIGGANYEFTVIKSQILQVLKHPSPPCCDATANPPEKSK